MDRKTKQVIILRKDLNMRKGKMISQGAHASMKVILDLMNRSGSWWSSQENDFVREYKFKSKLSSPIEDWLNGLFTKICLSVDSEDELDMLYNKAVEFNIPCSQIIDAGLTEFNGVPTKTAVAIGPWWSDEIDSITSHLKLL